MNKLRLRASGMRKEMGGRGPGRGGGGGGWQGNEIGSLIADTESMLRDCENSNLGEGT